MTEETFPPEWGLFDLVRDACEMKSVHGDPEYSAVQAELTDELHRLQSKVGDERYELDV